MMRLPKIPPALVRVLVEAGLAIAVAIFTTRGGDRPKRRRRRRRGRR